MRDFCCECGNTIESCSCKEESGFELEHNEIVYLNMLFRMFMKTGKSKGFEQRIEESLMNKFDNYFR